MEKETSGSTTEYQKGRKRQERIIRAMVRKDGRPKDDGHKVGSKDSRLICSAGPGQISCQEAVGIGSTSSHATNEKGGLRVFQAWSKLEVDGSQSLITTAALK